MRLRSFSAASEPTVESAAEVCMLTFFGYRGLRVRFFHRESLC